MNNFRFGHKYKSRLDTKAEVIARWNNMGLLEGLVGNMKDNIEQLYLNQIEYTLNPPDQVQ